MRTAATTSADLRNFLLVEQFDANAIGQRIKLARVERGLTQEDLADMAEGFGRRSLQSYETGGTIPFKHLREIGELLGRDTAWFLYGDPEEPNPDLLQSVATAVEALAEGMEETLRRLGRIEASLSQRAAANRVGQ